MALKEIWEMKNKTVRNLVLSLGLYLNTKGKFSTSAGNLQKNVMV